MEQNEAAEFLDERGTLGAVGRQRPMPRAGVDLLLCRRVQSGDDFRTLPARRRQGWRVMLVVWWRD